MSARGQSTGLNLREAMARVAAAKESAKGQTHSVPEPHPPVGVVNNEAEEDVSSNWDSESDHTPSLVATDPAHIQPVLGASKEPSAVQNERRERESEGLSHLQNERESEGLSHLQNERRERESEGLSHLQNERGERESVRQVTAATVGGGGARSQDPDNDSILSTESESDLPMFGGHTPSGGAAIPEPRPQPINQGLPPLARTPSPTAPSHTIVTPLSTTAGLETVCRITSSLVCVCVCVCGV